MKCFYCNADESRGNDLEECEACWKNVCEYCRTVCDNCGMVLCIECSTHSSAVLKTGESVLVCLDCLEDMTSEGLIDTDA